jgi:hypothetical protein
MDDLTSTDCNALLSVELATMQDNEIDALLISLRTERRRRRRLFVKTRRVSPGYRLRLREQLRRRHASAISHHLNVHGKAVHQFTCASADIGTVERAIRRARLDFITVLHGDFRVIYASGIPSSSKIGQVAIFSNAEAFERIRGDIDRIPVDAWRQGFVTTCRKWKLSA